MCMYIYLRPNKTKISRLAALLINIHVICIDDVPVTLCVNLSYYQKINYNLYLIYTLSLRNDSQMLSV